MSFNGTADEPCRSFHNDPWNCMYADGDHTVERVDSLTGKYCGIRKGNKPLEKQCYAAYRGDQRERLEENQNKYLSVDLALRPPRPKVATNGLMGYVKGCAVPDSLFDPKKRLTVFRGVQNGEVSLETDSVAAFLKGASVMSTEDKDSGSSTIIMFGELKLTGMAAPSCALNRSVVAKLTWPQNEPSNYNGLAVERELYRIVTPLIQSATPHLACHYMTTQLRWPDVSELTRKERKVHDRLYAEIANSKGEIADIGTLESTPISVVVTENGGGFSFQQWLYHMNLRTESDDEFNTKVSQALYQIVYTLQCLASLGVQHNDLHFGNIMIQTLPYPVYVSYNGRRMFTDVCVKLYDWDRGTKSRTYADQTHLYNTTTESFCAEMGSCNYPNYKFDLVTVFMMFNNNALGSSSHPNYLNDIARLRPFRQMFWETFGDTLSQTIVASADWFSMWCFRGNRTQQCEPPPADWIEAVPKHETVLANLAAMVASEEAFAGPGPGPRDYEYSFSNTM